MVKKTQKNRLILEIIVLILGYNSCFLLKPNTPKGIDPNPIYTLKLPEDIDISAILFSNDSTLAKKYNCKLKKIENIEKNINWEWIIIPATNDTNEYISRDIKIGQFKNDSEAFEMYSSFKSIYTIGFYSRLYKEKKQTDNRYCMIYETPQIDNNHGFFYLFNGTLLEFAFLINNYLVTITYTDFGSIEKKYKSNINNDIIMVSELFNDILIKYNEKSTDN